MTRVELKKIIQKIEGTKSKLNKHFFSSLAMWLIILGMICGVLFNIYSVNNTLIEVKKELKELESNQTYILLELESNEKITNAVTTTIKKNVKDINYLIDKYAQIYGVDKNLAHAVALVESGKNQNAKNGNNIGIYQVSKVAGRQVGVNNINTTEGNIKAGIAYLSYLKKKFGSDILAVSAYNTGENAGQKHGKIPNKKYVNKVMTVKNTLDKK